MPIGNTPDHTGKIPVPANIAWQGADLVERLRYVDRESEAASVRVVDAQYNKSGQRRTGPKARKELAEAQAKSAAANKLYQEVRVAIDAWEKENGLSVIDAWQAHTGRPWPYYVVQGAHAVVNHYVPKEGK